MPDTGVWQLNTSFTLNRNFLSVARALELSLDQDLLAHSMIQAQQLVKRRSDLKELDPYVSCEAKFLHLDWATKLKHFLKRILHIHYIV